MPLGQKKKWDGSRGVQCPNPMTKDNKANKVNITNMENSEIQPVIIPDKPINPEHPTKKTSRKRLWIASGIMVIFFRK